MSYLWLASPECVVIVPSPQSTVYVPVASPTGIVTVPSVPLGGGAKLGSQVVIKGLAGDTDAINTLADKSAGEPIAILKVPSPSLPRLSTSYPKRAPLISSGPFGVSELISNVFNMSSVESL